MTCVLEDDFKIPAEIPDPRYYEYVETEFRRQIANKSAEHLKVAYFLVKDMLTYYYKRDKKILNSVAYKVLIIRYVLLCEYSWFFKKDLRFVSIIGDWTCAICLDSDKQGVVQYPNCHTFHSKCIEQWLQDHSTCPLCRQPYFKSTVPTA